MATKKQISLCERTIGVLDHEDYTEFQAFRAQLITEHQPVGALENAMVDQIARSYWRMLRATRMETASFNLQMQDFEKTMLRFMESEHGKEAAGRAAAKEKDNDAALGFCFEDHQKLWQLHMRYQATATRDFHQAINALLKLQQNRRRVVAQASACRVETRFDAKIIPFSTAQAKQTTTTNKKLASFRNSAHLPQSPA